MSSKVIVISGFIKNIIVVFDSALRSIWVLCPELRMFRIYDTPYYFPEISTKGHKTLNRLLFFIRAVCFPTSVGCSNRLRSGIRVVCPSNRQQKRQSKNLRACCSFPVVTAGLENDFFYFCGSHPANSVSRYMV